MNKMAFQDAPQDNLETWNLVTKILFVSAGATALVLLLMAATLL